MEDEKQKSTEFKGIKDKANHNVYKIVSEGEELKVKERELSKRFEKLQQQ